MASAERETALYRCFDTEAQLLYIGVAYSPDQRFQNHASTSAWWPLVGRTTVEWHPNREIAEAAELSAIKAERPRYNRSGSETPMNLTRDFALAEDIPVAVFRVRMADVLNDVATKGKVFYLTSRGRRIAVVGQASLGSE